MRFGFQRDLFTCDKVTYKLTYKVGRSSEGEFKNWLILQCDEIRRKNDNLLLLFYRTRFGRVYIGSLNPMCFNKGFAIYSENKKTIIFDEANYADTKRSKAMLEDLKSRNIVVEGPEVASEIELIWAFYDILNLWKMYKSQSIL